MHKPLFPTFRMPAFDLPNRPSTSGEIKVLRFINPKLESIENLPKTSMSSIKSSIKDPKPISLTSSSACQADFQEEYEKQIEKEILTEPRMQFIQVNDIDQTSIPVQTPAGYLKFPEASHKFLTIDEISLSEQVQQFKVPPNLSNLSNPSNLKQNSKNFESKSKTSENPANPKQVFEENPEKIETQDFYRQVAEEKIRKIEEETLRLEQDMKMQNELLDKLDVNFRDNAEKERRETAARFIEKITADDEGFEEDDRVSRVLAKNQMLYERIQRAFTPKVEIRTIDEDDEAGDCWDKEKKDNDKDREVRPAGSVKEAIVNKRIAAAMNTAARAIQVSKAGLKPTVLKRPRK